jgi:pSer/pThr/pTyr-binding forkhead associated (FHA) protein
MPANRCPESSCEYFNRVLPNNAKVCPMCGTPLGNVIDVVPVQPPRNVNTYTPIPDQIPPEQTSFQLRPPNVQPVQTPPPPPSRPVLKLIHTTTGREFRLPGEEGSIGRRSQVHGTIPEIDLTGIPNEGIVSRSHVRVFWDWNQNTYSIIDTSKNGTYLNDSLLSPGVHYRLNQGDLLQLGQDKLVCFTVVVI